MHGYLTNIARVSALWVQKPRCSAAGFLILPGSENGEYEFSLEEGCALSVNHLQTGEFLIETERLILREMKQSDYDALCRILCDEEVMGTAYETAFSPEEAQGWLNRHLNRYKVYGFGLWAVVRKDTKEMIGQCGLTMQDWRSKEILEIGYLFQKAFWHKGYAAEAAIACKEYAFSILKADRVFSIIRDTNPAAQNVAVRNGMHVIDKDTKIFRNITMNFLLYSAEQTAVK